VTDRGKQVVIVVGSIAATAGLLALTFSLGSWAYQHRRYTLHDGRIRRLVAQQPTLTSVSQGILQEPGNASIAVPSSDEDLQRFVAQWSVARSQEIVAKRRKWGSLRAFGVGEMVYLLYFDDQGVLRDYVLLSR
jgi:hypothetical protein